MVRNKKNEKEEERRRREKKKRERERERIISTNVIGIPSTSSESRDVAFHVFSRSIAFLSNHPTIFNILLNCSLFCNGTGLELLPLYKSCASPRA